MRINKTRHKNTVILVKCKYYTDTTPIFLNSILTLILGRYRKMQYSRHCVKWPISNRMHRKLWRQGSSDNIINNLIDLLRLSLNRWLEKKGRNFSRSFRSIKKQQIYSMTKIKWKNSWGQLEFLFHQSDWSSDSSPRILGLQSENLWTLSVDLWL